ncbi:MAG: HU family DNA-binding protein [Prevotella sp.]|nr:HU family DNA-binding protein [Prevotella sp.]MBQ5606162.1 HU family DNA-binding protein [Prevotella sp.]MEE1092897.1 HU family DNA-binding protein [Prevotella sp.]
MAIYYRLYQNNNEQHKGYGKWYARAVMMRSVSTKELAVTMQENCTVKRGDIEAVLRELSSTMMKELADSKSVRIEGLGSFKVGLKTSGSDSVKEFTAAANVKGMHIIFTPESSLDRSSGKYIKEMLRGCTVKELPKNMIMEEYEEDNAKG